MKNSYFIIVNHKNQIFKTHKDQKIIKIYISETEAFSDMGKYKKWYKNELRIKKIEIKELYK